MSGTAAGSARDSDAGSPTEIQRLVPFLACENGTPPPLPMLIPTSPVAMDRVWPLRTLAAVALAHSELAVAVAVRAWSRGSALYL